MVVRGRIIELVRAGLLLMAVTVPHGHGQVPVENLMAESGRRSLEAHRISAPILLDGVLDEALWREAAPAGSFVQLEPYDGEPATETTEVRILFDNDNLYVGILCRDSQPDGILVNSLKEDFVPNDADYFQLILDTYQDQRTGFLFTTNPMGAKRDSQVADEGRTTNTDLDMVWEVSAHRTGDGWSAEMMIPFKSLSFDENSPEQVWGVNFARSIRRKNEIDLWSPVPRRFNITRLSLAGELHGLEGIERGRNLRLKPFVVGEVSRLSRNDHAVWKSKPGLDLKYSVTPSLTLDLTANTDFSQVEVDEQQVNLTRFPLFFPEKREFFLENEGIFPFGDIPGERGPRRGRETQLFFSRRIGLSDDGEPVPIWGGMRLSGQVGDYNLGVLNMQTKEFDGRDGDNFSVLRVKRNLLSSSDIGMIVTNRQATEGGDYNRAFGADANFKFFQTLNINGYIARTKSDGLQGEDWTRKAAVDWRARLVRLNLIYGDVEENFEPDLGFTQRTGVRYFRARTEGFLRPARSNILRQFRPHYYYTYQMDQQNKLLSKEGHYSLFEITLQNGTGFEIFYNTLYERLQEPFEIRNDIAIPVGRYHFDQWVFEYNSDPSRIVAANMNFHTGEFYSGDINQLNLSTTFRPHYRVSVENRYSLNDVSLAEGDFTTHLFRTKVDYYFSTRAFLNAFIQYNNDRKQLTSNIRFNFIHRPLSDLFLVYNEVRELTGARRNDHALTLKYTHLISF